jgi:hypothetical protein
MLTLTATDAAGNVAHTFEFGAAFGKQTVTGYTPGIDHLEFARSLFSNQADPSDGGIDAYLLQNTHVVNGATVITVGTHGDVVTLSKVTTSLHAGDFVFV